MFAGCYPLCPNQLVYPEIYPSEELFGIFKTLAQPIDICKLYKSTKEHHVMKNLKEIIINK